MTGFDGTAARQLDLIENDTPVPRPARPAPRPMSRNLRLLKQDVYAELTRRRRRAQIAARHALADAER